MKHTFAVSIGGAAGQGVATPGNIFARIFARRGLHVLAYNAYQSIIRGGHTFRRSALVRSELTASATKST
jgi:2-oxoglutarate ferredoxin oxidoreductase subunit alpha